MSTAEFSKTDISSPLFRKNPLPAYLENCPVAVVRCQGHLHRIVYYKKRIVLFDHDLSSEKMLRKLGKTDCRCLDVLELWKTASTKEQVPVLRQPHRDLIGEGHFANSVPPPNCSRPFTHNDLVRPHDFKSHWEAIIQGAVQACFVVCKYKVASCSYGHGGNHSLAVDVGTNRIAGKGYKLSSWSGKRYPAVNSHFEIKVPWGWYTQVYKRGLAVIDGVFIYKICDETKETYSVIAAKQSRGFNIEPKPARIVKLDMKLRWRNW